jgi:hypothetical protein
VCTSETAVSTPELPAAAATSTSTRSSTSTSTRSSTSAAARTPTGDSVPPTAESGLLRDLTTTGTPLTVAAGHWTTPLPKLLCCKPHRVATFALLAPGVLCVAVHPGVLLVFRQAKPTDQWAVHQAATVSSVSEALVNIGRDPARPSVVHVVIGTSLHTMAVLAVDLQVDTPPHTDTPTPTPTLTSTPTSTSTSTSTYTSTSTSTPTPTQQLEELELELETQAGEQSGRGARLVGMWLAVESLYGPMLITASLSSASCLRCWRVDRAHIRGSVLHCTLALPTEMRERVRSVSTGSRQWPDLLLVGTDNGSVLLFRLPGIHTHSNQSHLPTQVLKRVHAKQRVCVALSPAHSLAYSVGADSKWRAYRIREARSRSDSSCVAPFSSSFSSSSCSFSSTSAGATLVGRHPFLELVSCWSTQRTCGQPLQIDVRTDTDSTEWVGAHTTTMQIRRVQERERESLRDSSPVCLGELREMCELTLCRGSRFHSSKCWVYMARSSL